MKPVTRKTLFRILLSLYFFADGMPWIGRYLLPRKYKAWYMSPWDVLILRNSIRMIADVFRSAPRLYEFPERGMKIGDTIKVRKPARYCA